MKLFGFPIRIYKFFWLMCLLIGVSRFLSGATELILIPVLMVVVFFICLVHELGHAFSRRKHGALSTIVLGDTGTIGGAVSGYCAGPGNFTKRQKIKTALAGPMVNLIVAAVVFPLHHVLPLEQIPHGAAIHEMIWVYNLSWAVFNAAPVLPLDGGQIFRVLMADKNPLIVPMIGLFLSVMIAVLGAITGKYFACVLFAIFIYQNWMIIRKKQYLTY